MGLAAGVSPSVRSSVARPGVRRHQDGFAARQGLVQQPAVLGLPLLALAEIGFLDVDLILEGQAALGIQRPDGPADRRQRRDHPRQELTIELLRGDVGLGQLRDFRPPSERICCFVCSISCGSRGCSMLIYTMYPVSVSTLKVSLELLASEAVISWREGVVGGLCGTVRNFVSSDVARPSWPWFFTGWKPVPQNSAQSR